MRCKNRITDISAELDNLYGAVGTQQREEFDEAAWKFYLDQSKNK